MDKKDEKILVELIKNSRITYKQLGRKVGLSREVVTYRINKLVNEKIITDFYSVINTEKLGYSRNGCWMQLKNAGKSVEEELFSFLKNHPFVTYAGVVVGKWNVAFDILSRNKNHLIEIVKEIIKASNNRISDYIITNNSAEEEIYPTKMLGIVEGTKDISRNSNLSLDDKDKRLLELLSSNSRADYVELSSKLNLSANSVKYRLKQLENSGLIERYTISVDVTKLGYEFYNLQIKLNIDSNEYSLRNFIRNYPKAVYFFRYFGNSGWDMDIGIIANNSRELRKVILDFKNKFGDILEVHDIYHTLEVLKPNIAPRGVFT